MAYSTSYIVVFNILIQVFQFVLLCAILQEMVILYDNKDNGGNAYLFFKLRAAALAAKAIVGLMTIMRTI